VIVAHGGTIDKFIGDAVMAFWGAPTAQSEHALLCCRAALACRSAIEAAGVNDDHGRPLQIRIGINSGRMLVGNIGSELRLNYTVIGDSVNVASRLEGANKQYGTQILIGAETKRLIGDALLTREIDSIAVYGRIEGLAVHELIGPTTDAPGISWIEDYEQGLKRYRERDFQGAIARLEAVLRARSDDQPASLLLEQSRCLERSGVGREWQAISTLKTK
jgi:adenylate cyclase